MVRTPVAALYCDDTAMPPPYWSESASPARNPLSKKTVTPSTDEAPLGLV
jgi:hypothetical protein